LNGFRAAEKKLNLLIAQRTFNWPWG